MKKIVFMTTLFLFLSAQTTFAPLDLDSHKINRFFHLKMKKNTEKVIKKAHFTTVHVAKVATASTIPYYDVPLPKDIQKFVYEMEQKHGIDHKLIYALMELESGYNKLEVSDTKDYGLMQLNDSKNPATGMSTMDWLATQIGKGDSFNWKNPKDNIEAGTWYLKYLKGRWERQGYTGKKLEALTLLSYNRGYGGAKKYIRNHNVYNYPYVVEVFGNLDNLKEQRLLGETAYVR